MRIKKVVAAFVVGAAAAVGATAWLHGVGAPTVNTQPASSAGVPIQVYRTGTTPGGTGLWMHTQPDPNSGRVTLVPEGGTVLVTCFTQGPAVLGNPVWEFASYNGHSGYLTDYYLNVHWKATQDLINQGLSVCGTQPAQPQADLAAAHPGGLPPVVGGVTLGTPQPTGLHAYGPCQVVDYKHSSAGWVIVSKTPGPYVVRNGMLFGWFDAGGPGGIGCPTSNEQPIVSGKDSTATGVIQYFSRGALFWHQGMDHAVPVTAAVVQAMTFMDKLLGTPAYVTPQDTYCLRAVEDAWASAGVNLGGGYSAATYAAAHRSQLNTSTTPPPGAAVFWWGTPGFKDGHVAVSIGGGWTMSTDERGIVNVHSMSIADRNRTKPYAGWLMP
jgi:hypothetical protein